MKRNLFPFLGIAFVVAIAATGVFYGLFVGKISGASPAAGAPAGLVVAARPIERGMVVAAADVRVRPTGPERPEGAYATVDEVVGRAATRAISADEAVTAGKLAGTKVASAFVIPKGMRAISLRVADSAGLVPHLRAGHRVDVQSIQAQNGGEPQVRTLLSNVEVLHAPADPGVQPSAVTVLNVLVPAGDVERVALADSAAKVRIVLRNSDDAEAVPSQVAGSVSGVGLSGTGPRVQFQVRVAAAAAETVRELAQRTAMAVGGAGAVRIGLLPSDWKVEELEKTKSLQLLATENVASPHWHEVALQAGGTAAGEYDLRLRLTPRGGGNGMLRIRVRPELTLPQRGGVSSRRFSADLNVAEGQSVLVAGFERDAAAPALIEKLFQTRAPQSPGSELLLVVTPRMAAR